MEHIKTFLDTSTIHGLSWIANTKRWARLVWILVVIGGFSGAGYLIHESFFNWDQSPISTTIETLPISQITFPNVTVCPPKNLFLNLNYDIMHVANISIDSNSKKKVLEDILDVIQNEFYTEVMTNLSKIEDPERFHNWYYGYTEIAYPYYSVTGNQLKYEVCTSDVSGNISTQYFGEVFNVDKVERNFDVAIRVDIPVSVEYDRNTTLMIAIDKKTIKRNIGNDKMSFNNGRTIRFDENVSHWSRNFSSPTLRYNTKLDRYISQENITHVDLDTMPGFRLTWRYNRKLEPDSEYINSDATKQFVR